SGLNAFFHDVADLAGEIHSSFSFIFGGFNMQNLSTEWGVSQTCDHARLVCFQTGLADEANGSEMLRNDFGGDGDVLFFAFGDLSGDSPANRANLPLEVANAGFMCVIAADFGDGGWRPFAF